jgi:uncharacterized repeat protein (TIGR01451 family)
MEALALASALLLVAGQALAVGTPAGTTITSRATANYQDVNGNPLSSLSNIVTVTVSQVGAVSVGVDNAATVSPGDVHYYPHLITNAGNGNDVIDITAASGDGWTVTLYRDVNGNGTYDSGTDTPLADSDTDGTPDSGTLAADGTMRILAAVTVPTNATDALVDVVTVTGRSSFNTSASDPATDTSTVAAPVLSVVKSVAPAGPQPPGATLTYTMVVSNGGTGNATTVVLTDPIPTNTTYVGSSIRQDGTGRTDGADADSADYNITNPGKVTVNIGTLSPGGSTTLDFRVTIN